ncbi:AraC family transcriptional regulator [uncultured Mucilaginibacter sp.]|mgnify:CR=1 FL=1|uniref:helix-turn-helix domain-containing protein n=1 Tax=uncultured Mucilaginibacter sp. TaxID=797541 RepID=UPI0009684C69|nr:AraC family transcriptional regulator [uncultured Mucilaginibacter sp.]OJW18263.1 MAG: hypothetical protein BGO48_17060 [Mucilaginibacter sp. 44-25]PLW88978.1 MAG: hypothetical protein C0154_13930 [Mucilaginibacter sp.]PMP66123.1 MAG: hypothetical protein C0191_01590 [Mucilaginibacter sp.]HEK21245.1 AraC family transcriptional regulator [Bacteroidota bacterium]
MTLLTRWRDVNLKRVVPLTYLRYYGRHSTVPGLVTKGHFYLNEEYVSSEIFYEKIEDGFWMIALEIKAKQNTRYHFMPKNKAQLYSVNFISGSKKIGYKNGKDINWADNQVVFFDPNASYEIYLKAGTVVKCCRLIYTDVFIKSLTGKSENITSTKDISLNEARATAKAELFLQNRLFNILRYERGMYHYRASLFSTVYGLTTFFLRGSLVEEDVMSNDHKNNGNYAMLKAAKILEAHFSESFPGIYKLASDCNISVSKLKRDFKETYGITPLNYFRNIQINYAMASYRGREKTVKEIASDLGFKKSSTFSAWYKKINNHQLGIVNEFQGSK